MKTEAQVIADIRAENPTVQIGDDEQGYTQLTGDDYEAVIADWAEARYAKLKSIEDKESAKAALLSKLGITEDEAKLLLG